MVRFRVLRRVIFVLFPLLFNMPAEGFGATWYVRSSSGSYGTADGRSYATAFDGFSGIAWGSVNPGDTIYVCGTFTGETNNTGKSGTTGSPITLDGNCPGSAGSINGNGTTRGFFISHNNITLRNLTIQNLGSQYALQAGSTSAKVTNVILDNLTISNGSSSGVVLVGSNIQFINSTVHDIAQEGIWAIGSNDQTAGDVTIAYNTVYNIGTTGANTDGIFVGDRGLTPIYVHHNRVTNVLGTGGSACIDTSNTAGSRSQTLYIYNNYVEGCAYGIGAGDQDVADTVYMHHNIVRNATYGLVNRPLGTYYIYNNTVVGTGNSGLWHYVTGNHILHVKNNVVSGSYTYSMLINTSGATLDIDYNDYHAGPIRKDSTNLTLDQWRAQSGQDAHGLSVDPLFVSSTDYRLQAGSPLIGAGTNVGLTTDYAGTSIPTTPSIGAYQYGSGTGSGGGGGTPTAKVPNAPQILGIGP